MKEIKAYQCETCGMKYNNKETAQWCEKMHKSKHLLEMTHLFLVIADQLGLEFQSMEEQDVRNK